MNTSERSIRFLLSRGIKLCLVILFLATISTQVLHTKLAFASYSNTYPWGSAPCASSGANLGHTSGTGYWCSGYNWGENPCPSGDGYCSAGNSLNGYYLYDQFGESFRNCVSYTAWQVKQVLGISVAGWGNGADWNNSAIAHGYSDDSSPQVGDIAQWDETPQNQWGHVAYVYAVNNGIASYAEYNYGQDGNYLDSYTSATQGAPTHYIHIGNASTSSNTVLQVKKLTQADGTNEVVWSKSTDVSESWWRNGSGITLSNLIHISQGDIKSFDIALSSDNKHDLFTATTNNIWETWWYPGQGLHTSEILQNIGNIRKIIKSVGPDGVTQQLYVMTDTGVYEYWWNANSNGIQHDTFMTLANPVDEYKALEPDGTQALYVADQNYPYEQHWGPGITGLQQTTFSSVAGITSISFSEGGANNKHRLYIGASSGAIWEASWLPNGTVGYWYMTGGSPVVALQKWEDDSEQVIYEATAGGVYEYYWPTTSNTLSGDTIVGLSNVHAFVRSTDPGGVQSVYTATGTNIDESWWILGGDGIHTGQIE
jgi:surface antigen